ncbi:MAG: hypothetical protein ACYDCL_13035 [Myxococcales bacterium]
MEALLAEPGAAAKAPPEVAAAAVEAAQAKARPDVLWALSTHPTRAVGKSARRALHLLRSRGVDVGERPLPPPVKLTEEEPDPALDLCRATPIDGFGDRALWVPLKIPHGLELWEAILSDEAGVRLVRRVEMSRRQLRAHFQALSGQDVAISEVPRERAAALLAEAASLGGEPRALAELRELSDRLGPADLALAAPLSMGAPPLPPAEEAACLAESAALFEEAALRSFVPEEAALREMAVRIDEVEVSPLALDERQKAERRQRIVEEAIGGYFTPVRRARLARRLFELVDVWTREGRTPSSRRAAAAARQLAGNGPALENPFARAMFTRLLRLPAKEETPAEPTVTPGGLILPP